VLARGNDPAQSVARATWKLTVRNGTE
jgi:hypothetical protein